MINQYNIRINRIIILSRRISSKILCCQNNLIKSSTTFQYKYFSTETEAKKTDTIKTTKSSFLDKLIGEESNVASESFNNRWLMAVPAFATHMCIGSPWAWSIMADVCTRQIGLLLLSVLFAILL